MRQSERESKAHDDLPLSWTLHRKLHLRDLIAMLTGYIFFIGPLMAVAVLLNECVFHFAPHVPLRDQPSSTLYMILWFAIGIPFSFVGKYLWLFLMSRCLSRADVAPWIAYGVPRRLSRLDKALLRRYYRR